MTDAFADITDEPDRGSETDEQSGETDGSDTVTETATFDDDTDTDQIEATDASAFADDVRSTLPSADGTLDEKRYEDPDSDDKADDVDTRGLFRKPTLNELRYYAREGPYGTAIVNKPIDDAFKHGYEIVGDNTATEDGAGKIASFLDDYQPHYKLAEKKSRRDGMAVLMFQFDDEAETAAEPIPESPNATVNHTGFHIYTVDNLSEDLSDSEVADHTDFDIDQIYVTEGAENGGIAVVDDISDPDHGKILGYGIKPRSESTDVSEVGFVHESRCQHFVWGKEVDGDLGNNVTGTEIGESVLTPVLQPLKGAQMGYWAMTNILHRYSAPLHAVEPPEEWGQTEFDDARNKLGDLSMKSEAVLPPGAELNVAEGVSEFDPEPIYDVLVESICAGTVFTKSVLQGTQTGTVSGSETDVKGYFNGIHLLRQQRVAEKFHEAVKLVSNYDQETVPRVANVDGFEIDWGPLFKPTSLEQAEGAVSLITAATNGIKNYVLTPDEARSLVSEEWGTFDIDVDLDDLTEAQKDDLDRINIREAGQGPQDDEPDVRGNQMRQNGGGQPEGQTRESSQPTRTNTDALEELSDEELGQLVRERLADD